MRTLFLALFLLSYVLVSAQSEVSEQEVKREERFIEAKREALLGKTDDAIAMFETIVEEQAENDPAWFELARLRYAAGATDAAVTAMRTAYDLRPGDVYAAFLAELYQAAGRYREGAELYGRLIRQNPAYAENYLQQAAFLVRAQDIKGALDVYNALEQRTGVNVELSRRKHALYLGSGDARRAERELQALVDAFPQQVEYRHLLAGFYNSQNEDKKAREVYQEILRLQPADVRAQLALQDATAPAGGSGDADAELMTILGRADVDLDLKVGKLLPLIQQVASTHDRELADRALRLAAELRRVHPDAAKAAAIEGDLYYHSGRLPEAAEAYRATLELDDTVYPVWEQLLSTLYLSNQMAELRDYAEQALDIFPNRPSVYLHYALGEAFRGDYDEAGNLLQQAGLMVGGSPDAAAAVAEIQRAVDQLAGTGDGSDLNPELLPGGDRGPLLFYLAQRARPDADRLNAAAGETNTNALLLELMGDVAAEAGDPSAAADYYARARAAGSKSATLPAKARTKS